MKKVCKKGELTTQQIVGLIILITSFAIILFFLFRLNLQETTDKEICHDSVVMRGQSILAGNLDCKTNYVCISQGRDCEDFNYNSKIKINSKDQIMEAIADEMADCWWMFGEGKIDYVGGISFTKNKACSVCSIISFDLKIQEDENLKQITYSEFYNYLSKKEKGDTNYLNYLYGISNPSSLGSYLDNSFDFSKEYFVLTGLGKKGTFSLLVGVIPVSIISDSINYFSKNEEEKKLESMPVVILEKTSENYDKLGCDEFLTKA